MKNIKEKENDESVCHSIDNISNIKDVLEVAKLFSDICKDVKGINNEQKREIGFLKIRIDGLEKENKYLKNELEKRKKENAEAKLVIPSPNLVKKEYELNKEEDETRI